MTNEKTGLWLAADYTAPDTLLCAVGESEEGALKALEAQLEKTGRKFDRPSVFTRSLSAGDVFRVGD